MKNTLNFLTELKENNHREWFGNHKDEFTRSQKEFKDFINTLMNAMQAHDEIDVENTKVYRIYKDVRFSKDKTPYKTNWSANIKRLGKERRGGYYIQIEHGNTFIAGGFFGPNAQDLLHIRKHLEQDAEALKSAIYETGFEQYFGEMQGEKVKTAPKGFKKEAENIDLIRNKQFYFRHQFNDAEVIKEDFLQKVSAGFGKLRPFFDVMSEILTTDLNGAPLRN